MVIHLGSSRIEGLAKTKLDELRAMMQSGSLTEGANGKNGAPREALAAGAAASDADEFLAFTEATFSRAPVDYLQRTDAKEMFRTAKTAYEFFCRFSASQGSHDVAVIQSAGSAPESAKTIVMTCVTDRPFIVDTVTEALSRRNLERIVLFHPIFQIADGRRVSMVYIECEALNSSHEVEQLRAELKQALSEVIVVTEDFSRMLIRVDDVVSRIEADSASPAAAADRREVIALLRWLSDGGFVFLGYREWNGSTAGGRKLAVDAEKNLGLFADTSRRTVDELAEAERDADYLAKSGGLAHFSKILAASRVHRSARMDLILLRTPGEDPSQFSICCFIGLLTSKSLSQEASSVPVIREKIQKILMAEGLLPNSHAYKEIISIAESMPKSDLLQYPLDRLRKELMLVFEIQRRQETRISFFLDSVKRFAWINVIVPRSRYSDEVRQEVQEILERKIGAPANSAEWQVSATDYPLIVLRLLVPNPNYDELSLDPRELESKIKDITQSWEDGLYEHLLVIYGKASTEKLFAFYAAALPEQFKATTSPKEALEDIAILEGLSPGKDLDLRIHSAADGSLPSMCRLRMYKRGEPLTLSEILPYLENAGFTIVSESVFPVAQEGAVWAAIYDLYLYPTSGKAVEFAGAEQTLLPGLRLILAGEAENDKLNSLLLNPGLSCGDIAILRLLMKYLLQIKASPSESVVVGALVDHPEFASMLVQYFCTKFDPTGYIVPEEDRFDDANGANLEKRLEQLESIKQTILGELKTVSLLPYDRAIRAMLNLLEAAIRTNFYVAGRGSRLAIKIECAKIARMPSPRPLYEIFVSSPEFDAVHLRGGKVARGGLRWSDRVDDFRHEVLGLMKTQMVKNSIIIPVGAKGGFVVKNRPKVQSELLEKVRECYSGLIRSMLEITDNLIDGKAVHPNGVVMYDDYDPYLVVAADRGTATFSDLANRIAEEEFGFWLADAFASGGSAGYDHKKYGITARGAWEAVCRHFREIGIDIDQQEFTVVGIGDMSGDVFGNGMLLSRNIQLVAAFNHRHIFVDPHPDAQVSYDERKRLFLLPHSQWSDYEAALISKGGGVYDRASKEIELTPEAQAVLGCSESLVSGEELIRIILKAPVDLLWNGGIGTYVKAFSEDHNDVQDRANDDVRVDARDLRARVIGEGGNLGLTQLARIEYSRIGGRVNMDAVDNSGGVDLSDLEVNLKILLREPMRRQVLTREQRDQLLLSCAEQACEKVVSRNRSQSMVLSLAVRRSRENIGYYRGLINSLESEGFLDRDKEFLPDDKTLGKRIALKAGLTRPELAILIAYSKMSLYNRVISSRIPEEPYLQSLLASYFPSIVTERYGDYLELHPLKREIIATQVANSLVERMGASFVYRLSQETGADYVDVITAFLAADSIISAGPLAKEVGVLDKANSTRSYLSVLLRLQSAIDSMTRWILDNSREPSPIAKIVSRYRNPFRELVKETGSLISELERSRFQDSARQLATEGLPTDCAVSICAAPYSAAYLDIITITGDTKSELIPVAQLYSALAQALQIRQLLEQANDIDPSDRWEALALRTISSELRKSIAALTRAVIGVKGDASEESLSDYLEERKAGLDRYRASVQEFNNKPITIPALMVISNQLAALARSNV